MRKRAEPGSVTTARGATIRARRCAVRDGRSEDQRRCRRSSAALVVRAHRKFGLGVGGGLRRDRDQLAAAVLDGGVLQLVVLALGVELDAGTGADIVGDVGRADGVGERLRIGRARPLVGVRGDQQRLERIDVVGVEIDAGMRLGERGLELLGSASCSGRTRARSSSGRRDSLPRVLRYWSSYQPGPMLSTAIGDQRCLTSSRVIRMASLSRLTISSASAPVALALATSTERSRAVGS